MKQVLNRGYRPEEVAEYFVGAFEYENRPELLSVRASAESSSKKVLALKLPFTPRVDQIETKQMLQAVHKEAMQGLFLVRYQETTRFVIALTRTPALRDLVKEQ